MKKFKLIKDAIVAISFLDNTYRVYSGAISEVEVYREDEYTYFPASITVDNEMIIKLRFPQGFTINQYDQNVDPVLPEVNMEGN